ncbi:MAG: DUF1611 domain-containing protein [Halobacteriales archaeon]
MRVALLAHDRFPDRAKTAVGVLRYSDHEVVAVVDRRTAGGRVRDHLDDVQDAPIVASFEEVPPVEALVIGVAPIGGGFEPSWRPDVRAAIEAGCDVIAGLHYLLAEDEAFAALAAEHGVELRDVRVPPDDLTVSEGIVRDLDVDVVLTVGTDCSVGKMTTTMELVEALRARGVDAGAIPTGQTGILIEGWGIAVDRVISDFAAGAVERMIRQRADEHDLLVVEGQGSITHPAYSGVTCSILHGAMPDGLVLCHVAGREVVHGYEDFDLPGLNEVAALYERLARPVAPTALVGAALNTSGLGDAEARSAVDRVEHDLGVACADPVRHGADDLAEAIEAWA